MALPVFVINLQAEHESLKTVSESIATNGGSFRLERIDAIDGRTPEHKTRIGTDEARFQQINGRDILPGEYGCYRSHLKALEAFLADGTPYGIIIEDDVVFDETSAKRILNIIDSLPEFGVVKLMNHRSRWFVSYCETESGDRIGRAIHGPQGSAAAYLVSREGAQQLLSSLSTMELPWDVALERFWFHQANLFSSRDNVLTFSSHSEESNISGASNSYSKVKYPWYKRLGTAAFRFREYISRAHSTMLQPKFKDATQVENSGLRYTLPAISIKTEIVAAIAILLFVSAVWIETDAYRYTGIGFTLAAIIYYGRNDFWKYEKPYIGWAGIICLAWSFYVLIRLAYIYIFFPGMGHGSSEGIYIFPLFYATFGHALLLYVRRPFPIAAAFVAISFLTLIFGISYDPTWSERAITLLHNNPIHAAIGSGFIALCAISFGIHVLRRETLDARLRLVLSLLSVATFLTALVAIYSLHSKGVWLAMAVALPVFVVLVAMTDKSRIARIAALACVIIGLLSVFAGQNVLQRVGGATANTSLELLSDLASGEGITQSFGKVIDNPATGESERERLMLWANTLYIWSENPVWGAGISWLKYWENRPYQATDHMLIHNGYMEVAIRYGLAGLAFYAFLTIWAFRTVWQATQAGLINKSAFQCYGATMVFFGVTLLSNSNNRLAIGESYMWLAFGFAFYCQYLLQQHRKALPRTYI